MDDRKEKKDEFNLNGLWSLSNKDNICNLSLSVYNATPQLVMWDKSSAERKPVFKMRLVPGLFYMMRDQLPGLLKSAPGDTAAKRTYINMEFNADLRRNEKGSSITFYKNASGLYCIDVIPRPGVQATTFTMMSHKGFSTGDGELTDTLRSELGFRTFLDVLSRSHDISYSVGRWNYEPPKPQSSNSSSNTDSTMFG